MGKLRFWRAIFVSVSGEGIKNTLKTESGSLYSTSKYENIVFFFLLLFLIFILRICSQLTVVVGSGVIVVQLDNLSEVT